MRVWSKNFKQPVNKTVAMKTRRRLTPHRLN